MKRDIIDLVILVAFTLFCIWAIPFTESDRSWDCDTDMSCYEECVQIGGEDCE